MRSLVVALTAALFTGMVLALQTAVNMARFGAENYVGPVVALSILRELGPVLTAILVGGKVASGITAELGSMKVTEQIDALRAARRQLHQEADRAAAAWPPCSSSRSSRSSPTGWACSAAC